MSQPIYNKHNPHCPHITPELGYIEIMARKGRTQAYAERNSTMVDKWQHVIDNVAILIKKEYKK